MPKDMSLHPAVVCFIAWNHETKMESPTSWGSSSPSSFGHRHSLMTPALSILPEPAFAPLRDLNPETDVARVIDYVDDDPSLPEQPVDGSQEPDNATDDYCYPEGAYYYATTADDWE
ncbi:hypothetical protein VPH35_001603 [Triticum aestivum]|uniref:uncharacterized protein isoform X1 n=1 Tax=Triticum aestivum TaxID=4565 RepID=UPI001D0340B7|nr:uncharacterized protein LOC123109553 isoform X1 [Triticum aestivum]